MRALVNVHPTDITEYLLGISWLVSNSVPELNQEDFTQKLFWILVFLTKYCYLDTPLQTFHLILSHLGRFTELRVLETASPHPQKTHERQKTKQKAFKIRNSSKSRKYEPLH